MNKNKHDIESIIDEEKKIYIGSNAGMQKKNQSKRYFIWKYISCFRYAKYYSDLVTQTSGLRRVIARIRFRYYMKKKNRLSYKSGVEITNQCQIGRRLNIWHSGVIINCDLGDDCVFHGNNVIGNKGDGRADEKPELGNGVDIGAGAVIIGKIKIADNCTIGANAVITKSFTVPNSVVIGVPGRLIKNNDDINCTSE